MKNSFIPWAALPAAALGAAVVAVAAPAQAFSPVTYGYVCAKGSLSSCAISQAQFKTTVSSSGDNVKFTFKNTGDDGVFLTDIGFNDTLIKTLGGFVGFEGSSGGAHKVGDYKFTTSVANNESIGIVFSILDAYRFTDPMNAVITDLRLGGLTTTVRAQAFASGGDDNMVNEEVPEPLTILGSAAAIAGGVTLKRRAGSKDSKKKAMASQA